MDFLMWDNQADADESLAAVNVVYGCTYEDNKGYRMTTWDVVTKSDAEEKWGFAKPVARIGKLEEELIRALVSGYTEVEKRPSDWLAEDV